jgi:Helix-turn-helix domain of resolvase
MDFEHMDYVDKTEVKRIQELEDDLKIAELRIAEMRAERDEARDLMLRMEEHVRDSNAMIEQWIGAFGMQLDDNGLWAFEPNLQTRFDELLEKYQGLVKRWNRFVNEYNGVIRRQPVGRPLNASDAQCARVIKLRKGGMSIRAVMDETNLGMQTVRTILGRESWTDRASKKRLERIDHKPVSDLAIRVKARKRVRDALPTRINKVLAEGADLIKEAKGLGK